MLIIYSRTLGRTLALPDILYSIKNQGKSSVLLFFQVCDYSNHRRKPAGTKRRSQVTGQGTGHRAQGTGHRAQVTGHRAQGTGHRAQKTQ